ncbi:glycosyltransferase family 2 protein [Chitinophaga niabensis]|uniref:Glycosyl transferase family 2 n=1 Tax=Chitinophaga niabensis TaxID=536979 RepID=A0A1N6JXU1_9BACT|nr:glycosyltransferase [Chitinophaga niabensis]SIO49073.1 Glycosyl transferase family 2 [Chitinophaga niabensis]
MQNITSNAPLVTVFMAVYNGGNYISAAIQSVLAQSFSDFELLIINDGSTDLSMQIVESFQDPRIRVLHNPRNMGLFETRNRGIREARGTYFATLDCDDIAFPDRLAYQLEQIRQNPAVAVSGSRAKLINSSSLILSDILLPVGDGILPAYLFFSNCYINSATIIRTDVLREISYRPGFEPAEDYDLFVRIAEKYPIRNSRKYVVYYRVHDQNVTNRKKSERKLGDITIVKYQLEKLGITPTPENIAIQHLFITKEFADSPITLPQIEEHLMLLKKNNKERKVFEPRYFDAVLMWQWTMAVLSKSKNASSITRYLSSELFQIKHLHMRLFEHFYAKIKNPLRSRKYVKAPGLKNG